MKSRRSFVRDSGIIVGVSMFPSLVRAQVGNVAPSDQVRVGVIGCNGMGFSDLRSILKVPEVECGGPLEGDHFHNRSTRVDQRGNPENRVLACRNHHRWKDANPQEAKDRGLQGDETLEAANTALAAAQGLPPTMAREIRKAGD